MRHLCDWLHPFWASNTNLYTKKQHGKLLPRQYKQALHQYQKNKCDHTFISLRDLHVLILLARDPKRPHTKTPLWNAVKPGGQKLQFFKTSKASTACLVMNQLKDCSKWCLSLFPFNSVWGFFCLFVLGFLGFFGGVLGFFFLIVLI